MMWILKPFDQLETEELFAIYKERVAVFVVEQACPYPEVDDLDKEALHLFAKDQHGITAYCRLIPTKDQLKLGRVLVVKRVRKSGLGRDLIAKALEVAEEYFPDLPVYAQAQAYLEQFYGSFGFKPISEIYLEDDIPHLDMMKD
ncbi:GNAT family N-acetyltransferase [Streptococcus canis]|nr:GNAT family N-acetyltransferase [Streptococcus canis]MDV5973619.1 GNAT family N-acetyltransferase [Streptococcus canis]QKG77251.1 GNAT family N-acetyltransferase [Streptococcus canis]